MALNIISLKLRYIYQSTIHINEQRCNLIFIVIGRNVTRCSQNKLTALWTAIFFYSFTFLFNTRIQKWFIFAYHLRILLDFFLHSFTVFLYDDDNLHCAYNWCQSCGILSSQMQMRIMPTFNTQTLCMFFVLYTGFYQHFIPQNYTHFWHWANMSF